MSTDEAGTIALKASSIGRYPGIQEQDSDQVCWFGQKRKAFNTITENEIKFDKQTDNTLDTQCRTYIKPTLIDSTSY